MKNEELHEDISKIIYDGVRAPSGENSQPWRFVVEDNHIFIFNIKERDTTLYNSGQHGSYTSHGALIENIIISATHFGYISEVIYFPSTEKNLVAKITLINKEGQEDELYNSIHKRCTNRNAYSLEPIEEQKKNLLIDEAASLGFCTFKITNNPEQLKTLATACIAVEKLIFENKIFHKFFFEHFFTEQRNENMPSGFYINTLGMNTFEKVGVKLAKSWFFASIMRITGIAKINLMMRKKHYLKSAAFGAIIAYGDEPVNYIKAGRTVERVWLKATSLNISMQPCVGVLYLYEGLLKNAGIVFTNKEQGIVEEARNKILEVFDVQGKTIPMFFRMGYGEKPEVKSFRFEPEIDYI